MECCVTCWNGTEYLLPEAVEWEFSYGLGSPCDAFALTCVWTPGLEKELAEAVRFRAKENGETVFTGVVDEYRCLRDEKGSRLELSGRGMQALLLDNGSLPMEYQVATRKDILRDHVTPYGIETVGGAGLSPVSGFAVESGQSEWSVLHEFVCRYNGVTPRFDRLGRLWLDGWEDGERKVLDDGVAVTALSYGESRYGVLSEVVVRDKVRGVTETVRDADFIARGGSCRRVVTMPGCSAAPAMRYTGQYQLRASRAEQVRCEVTLPALFAAFPGEIVSVERTGFGGNGVYRVLEAAVGVDGSGAYTSLILGEPDALVT